MRKALFAMILVAAAFAGGAVMNGPGLERLKAAIRSRIAPDAAATPGTPREVPAARVAPLTLGRERARPEPSSAPGLAEPKGPDGPPESGTGSSAIAIATPPPRSESAPVDPPGLAASSTPPPPAPAPPEAPASSDPAVAPASQSSTASGARDWADLRRRMRSLGVSRYEVEGEPGGRARFRCLIPLAGRRAVGQQFEGEGDDDLQAAEAALRRVALWRATETPPP